MNVFPSTAPFPLLLLTLAACILPYIPFFLSDELISMTVRMKRSNYASRDIRVMRHQKFALGVVLLTQELMITPLGRPLSYGKGCDNDDDHCVDGLTALIMHHEPGCEDQGLFNFSLDTLQT